MGDDAIMTYTPGPWEVGEDDANGQAVVRSEHTEICTCWHHCVGSIEQQMRANALLIAAAPELLEALKAMVNECEAVGSPSLGAMAVAITAIAKAEPAP